MRAPKWVKPGIIVIGASAGGVEALEELARGIPPDIPAALFVVLHIPSWAPSSLPDILTRSGWLPAAHPRDNEPIRAGHIYVAPPDHHIIIEEERIHLWRGPKENRQRPAINVLFRSAAVAHRERVVGMVLSGYLDDGSAGLWWVKRYGGVAIVQDPRDALVPDMPCSALDHVDVDYTVKVAEAGDLLSKIVGQQNARPAQKLV